MLKLLAILTLPVFLFACGASSSSSSTAMESTISPFEIEAAENPAGDEASTGDESNTAETRSQLELCAVRLERKPEQLDEQIRKLTGRDTYSMTTDAAGVDGVNVTWDFNGADVLCLDSPATTGGLNLIQKVAPGQVLFGSSGSEYIGIIDGGIVFAGNGRDIVGTLESGLYYGGDGDDLIASPADHGLYDGWSFVETASDGMRGGVFSGDAGDDHVATMTGGEFYGDSGYDSVRLLAGGVFYGGDDMDSISDPLVVESGEMTGGDFYGEDGNDRADRVTGGSFKGGAGNDLVEVISSASFEGMQGEDTVYALGADARFTGGPGSDTVDSMSDGIYDGGDDIDRLEVYAEGSVLNVESVPACLQAVTSRSKCLVLTPQ